MSLTTFRLTSGDRVADNWGFSNERQYEQPKLSAWVILQRYAEVVGVELECMAAVCRRN